VHNSQPEIAINGRQIVWDSSTGKEVGPIRRRRRRSSQQLAETNKIRKKGACSACRKGRRKVRQHIPFFDVVWRVTSNGVREMLTSDSSVIQLTRIRLIWTPLILLLHGSVFLVAHHHLELWKHQRLLLLTKICHLKIMLSTNIKERFNSQDCHFSSPVSSVCATGPIRDVFHEIQSLPSVAKTKAPEDAKIHSLMCIPECTARTI
jgi:hypothetical protein